jgi:N4-gp56 family major capsid protein
VADTLTTTNQVPPAVAIYYDRTLLKNARPKLHHEEFALQRPLPQKSGNTVKFRRFATLSTAETPLPEGYTPPGKALSKTDLLAQVSWYGDYVHTTDVVDMTVEDPILTVAYEELGDQKGRTRDKIIRNIIVACASSSNAAGGSNGGTPTEITKADIDDIVKTLLGNDADMFVPQISASTGVGTAPIREAFWGIMHTDLLDDLEDVSNFISVANYPEKQGISGEWGATGNVRWRLSSVAHKSTDSPAQYYLPIIGKESYGVTDLEGAAETITMPFGSGGTSDPLKRKATAGWKMVMVARILNDYFMHVLKVTHS